MPEDLSGLQTLLRSGNLAYGEYGRVFESKLADYLGNSLVLTVNSYNSAISVALSIIGIGAGDQVIASPISCLASNMPIVASGAKVVWADIDPKTGTLDPESVRSKISKNTKAIIHNHHCGYVGHIDEINRIGAENSIVIIDDGIEAFGSDYGGSKLGNNGTDITIFSFQTIRLPNTVDGGAICFSNKNLYEKAKLVRDYGINRANFRDEHGEINPNCDIALTGFGATMSELNSYIGVQQMEIIDELLARQRSNGDSWVLWFQENYPGVEFLEQSENSSPNYWVFGILTSKRLELLHEIRTRGFYSSGVHLNNNCYSVFGENPSLPGVHRFKSRFLAVPSGWWFDKCEL